MDIKLNDLTYKIIGTVENITVADSFVVRKNKIGSGNGEAKLYIGHESTQLREFYGNPIRIEVFMLKKDIVKYLEDTKAEFMAPEQPYNLVTNMPQRYIELKSMVETLPNELHFTLTEQTQIEGPRIYVKSDNEYYNLLRELSLPNITYISILKLNRKNNEIYYLRLFADFFGNVVHPGVSSEEVKKIEESSDVDEREKEQLQKARIGQGTFRSNVLNRCAICPFTLISDDRLLIASHIKPWVKSNNDEKVDGFNGFMFTPTYDYLFDRGYITFQDDKTLELSPFLSNYTYSRLNIRPKIKINRLIVEGTEGYLEYHRANIFKA